jgi:hypothetical protein
MNKELLMKVAKHVLAEPNRLDMNHLLIKDLIPGGHYMYADDDDSDHDVPPCGIVGCIAGWSVVISSGDDVIKRSIEYWGAGTKALELTPVQADRLFREPKRAGRAYWFGPADEEGSHGSDDPDDYDEDGNVRPWKSTGWPTQFSTRYTAAKSARERAIATAERIIHFIKTDGEE